MKIQRLSTASYKFFSPEGIVVMVDPWLTNDPCWPLSERKPERLKEIDVIAITHAHLDHASGVDEIVRQNENTFVIVQSEFGHYLEHRRMKNVIRTNFGATIELKGIKFSMVSASHTSSWLDQMGKRELFGTAAGYIIELENGEKVYVSGDTGLTADMKFVVSDFFKPQISILPVTGLFAMEPEQAAYAANVIGSKYVVPSHDFPKEVSDAADPEAYGKLVKRIPVLHSYKKVEAFLEIMKRDYPHIETVYIPIGETVEIG
jgi:L-ascorbate metabolism protein UlaG (beta-lactamase superfamily)